VQYYQKKQPLKQQSSDFSAKSAGWGGWRQAAGPAERKGEKETHSGSCDCEWDSQQVSRPAAGRQPTQAAEVAEKSELCKATLKNKTYFLIRAFIFFTLFSFFRLFLKKNKLNYKSAKNWTSLPNAQNIQGWKDHTGNSVPWCSITVP